MAFSSEVGTGSRLRKRVKEELQRGVFATMAAAGTNDEANGNYGRIDMATM